ncbi:hypothetical protein VTJ49DRAFT_7718 [Mycothermus thermophilus]|uniref:Uncharacterized protein n=1 Tax=Humicola insolens TaxID=85995 RepID=A0ABR3VG22_HUMIN
MTRTKHYHTICGLYYVVPHPTSSFVPPQRHYLPQLSLSVKSKIVASTSRTVLTQTFVNPKDSPIPELRYTFPLYDGVSVVGFVCTINDERVIRGVVKEKAEARAVYQAAVDRGETAGLLEQLPDASDVFTTTVGNVPANATLKVDITYLGELKHDAEVDGIRFTIPTSISPRYGDYPGELLKSNVPRPDTGISIVVDVEMPDGCNVKNVQSPSHPISVTLGNTSDGAAKGAEMSLQKASATLSQATTELGDDFVLQVVATNTGRPVAMLETHPTLPNQRALMATLVPKFNLPQSKPEIVFLCDRSGSMGGIKVQNMKKALHLFLKSLPVGVKFNICSFGSHFKFLFDRGSKTYDQSTLEKAMKHVDGFDADFGGTEIYEPMAAAFKKRYEDMDLELFLLTDGEIWDQHRLFELIRDEVAKAKGRIRVFTLGIGSGVSHALIEGVANAGNGFSQSVGDTENMNSKVVRMLKASLTPHVNDYTLEIKYGAEPAADSGDDDFELIEKVMDALAIDVKNAPPPEYTPTPEPEKKPISLFDESADPDTPMTDASRDTTARGKYSHVPPVPEPKLLQAPFKIPPLFPFSRTTVYLLLSPGSVQKQPKSVILRGTSPYGPVELEIPVTILEENGETIHQLAARKAVRELEDGRGWIFHARDAGSESSPLIKDKYQGRFDDMVEREAVRLGVRYQVGGKWCSFVAVDANDREGEAAAAASEEVQAPQVEAFEETITGPLKKRKMAGRDVLSACAAPPPGMTAQQSQQMFMAAPSPALKAGFATRSRRPPFFGGLGGLLKSASARFSSSSAPMPPPPPAPMPMACAAPMAMPGGAPPPPPAMPYAPGYKTRSSGLLPDAGFGRCARSVPKAELVMHYQREMLEASAMPCPDDDEEEMVDESSEEDKAMADAAPAAESGPVGKSGEDMLAALVAAQSFAGSWKWEAAVLAVVLGKDTKEVKKVEVPKELGGRKADEALATAMVLVFLEEKLRGMKDEWEMMADKAREWLEGELKKVGETRGVEEYLEVAKGWMEKEQGVKF